MVKADILDTEEHMNKIKSFGIIGGDIRQLYCARSALDDGYAVLVSGFEKCDEKMGIENVSPETAVNASDALILPLPVSKDGRQLYSPFSDKPVSAADILSLVKKGQPVFCGLEGSLPASEFSGIEHYFYGKREDFAVANAVPTAEGAIEAAMKNSDITLASSECLVAGYGRIGRVLSSFLRGLGAEVTVSARKSRDIEFIRASGMRAVNTGSIKGRFDFIFNTVPSLVFDRKTLADCAAGAIIIDLASQPGGVDREAAGIMNIPVYHVLSLPGKVAPKTAGVIIKNAVYNIIGEEGK